MKNSSEQIKSLTTSLLILGSLISINVGCQKVDDMHDATMEMSGTTKDMRDITKGMSKNTAEMKGTTNELLTSMDSMRLQLKDVAATSAQMNEKMNALTTLAEQTNQLYTTTAGLCSGSGHALSLSDRGDVKGRFAAPPPQTSNESPAKITEQVAADKISLAAQYAMAFQYQSWGLCGDTKDINERERLQASGVQEFFFNLANVSTKSSVPSPMVTEHMSYQSNDLADIQFNALAITSHFVDELQVAMLIHENSAAKKSGTTSPLKAVSMYSMIEESLKLQFDIEHGQASGPVKEYQHNVISNRALAIRLLQARHNFLAALFVGKIKEKTIGTRDRIALFTDGANGLMHRGLDGMLPWNVSIDSFNSEEIKDFSEFLTGALETRVFLKSIGESPIVADEFLPVLYGLRLQTADKSHPGMSADRTQLIHMLQAIQQ